MIDRVTCDYAPAGRVHLPRGEDSDGGGGTVSPPPDLPSQHFFFVVYNRDVLCPGAQTVSTPVSKKRRRGGKAYTQNVPTFYRASHFLPPHLIFFICSLERSLFFSHLFSSSETLWLYFFLSYSPYLHWQAFFFIIQKVSPPATCSSPASLTTLFPPLCHISGTESCLTILDLSGSPIFFFSFFFKRTQT